MIDGTENVDVEIFGREVSPGELSLSRLARFSMDAVEIQAIRKRNAAVREAYKKKYGDSWRKIYNQDKGRLVDNSYDIDMKFVNSCIYHGSRPGISDDGEMLKRVLIMWQSRMQELYGSDYDELRYHRNADPRVVELLLDDAMRTGKWKELPDELQPECHKRASNRP